MLKEDLMDTKLPLGDPITIVLSFPHNPHTYLFYLPFKSCHECETFSIVGMKRQQRRFLFNVAVFEMEAFFELSQPFIIDE